MGRSLVFALLAKGARVAAIDINQKGLEETVAMIANRKEALSVFKLDITDKQEVERSISQIISEMGPVITSYSIHYTKLYDEVDG